MDRDDLRNALELSKDVYQKGYREGFEDACKLIGEMASQLGSSALETLKGGNKD